MATLAVQINIAYSLSLTLCLSFSHFLLLRAYWYIAVCGADGDGVRARIAEANKGPIESTRDFVQGNKRRLEHYYRVDSM